jgi:hypothetical protein
MCRRGIKSIASTLSFEECEISDSAGTFGGIGAAMLLFMASDCTMNRCRFLRNHATVSGGAIFIEPPGSPTSDPSRLVVEHSLFIDNVSPLGPAISSRDAILSVQQCTMAGNRVLAGKNDGGVIDIEDFIPRAVRVENTIVAFNEGLPFRCRAALDLLVTCCDVFGNESDSICGQDGGGNIYVDPLFCDLSTRSLYLQMNSPCAPAYSPMECELIGALEPTCASAVTETTWGLIKHQYISHRSGK